MKSLHPSGKVPLSRLIQDLEDGVISATDRDLLMDHLRHDPEARHLYLKQIRLAALLRQTAETRVGLGTMPVSMEMLRRAKRNSAITALAGGLAAVLALALTLMAFQVKLTFASRPAEITMDRSLDATYKVHWEGDARAYEQLRPGDHVTLERGLLRFTFPSKVEAIVEGPSDFELLSTSEIRLNGGTAWFRVPEAGRGFTVRTDRARIVDLGTEFGVSFDHDQTVQVHVTRGKVRVEPLTIGAPNVELVDGQAIAIDSLGKTRTIDFEVQHFRREFHAEVPYVHWSFDRLVNDTFPAKGTMTNVADFRVRLQRLDGMLEDDDLRRSQTDGIRGKAFQMQGDGIFAQSDFPGIGSSVPRTVAAWIRHRGDGRPAPLSSAPRTGHGATTPFGNQAYLLNYTNSGIVTSEAAIADSITADTTYTLSFHAAALPEIGRADYLVELVAFDSEHDDLSRQDMRHGYRPGTVLSQASGEVSTSDMSHRDQRVFTARHGDPNLGKTLAIRLVKSGGSILFDNLQLTRKTGNSPATVIFEESFETPVVTGYAEQVFPASGWVGPVAGSQSLNLGFGAPCHGTFSMHPAFATPYIAWDSGNGSRFAAYALATQPLRWSVADGVGFSDSPVSGAIIPGEWTHVATVRTGRLTADGHPEVVHYINGRPVGGDYHTRTQSGHATPANLHIGILPGATPGDPTLNGDIDELFIFRGALNESEIQSLMDTNQAVFRRKR